MSSGHQKVNLIGQKFNHLTVIERLGSDPNKSYSKCMWKCECDCNERKIVIVSTGDLKSDNTKSCGHIVKESSKNNIKLANKAWTKYTPEMATAHKVYEHRYADGDLDFETFLTMSQLNCEYCGAEPINCGRLRSKTGTDFYNDNAEFTYMGLDRIDPGLPHNSGNLIPACKICNWAKSDYSYQEFIEWVKRIGGYLFKTDPFNHINKARKNKVGSLTVFEYMKITKGIASEQELLALIRPRAKYPPVISTAKQVYRDYNFVDISLEEFLYLSLQPCSYCGIFQANISTIYKEKHSQFYKDNCTFKYNGLDRVDSNLPHCASNIVPACGQCNRSKSNLSLPDFLSWLQNLCSHTPSHPNSDQPPIQQISQTLSLPFSISSD